MCIVIDTNSLASVFDQKSEHHAEFRPVLEWIVLGNGKIVYGGTTYKRELAKATKYFRLLVELKKVSKIVEIDSVRVGEIEQRLAQTLSHSDFDDPHIVAIIIASGCRLICSADARAFRYFRKLNRGLLQDKNIADCCRPLSKLPKAVGLNLHV